MVNYMAAPRLRLPSGTRSNPHGPFKQVLIDRREVGLGPVTVDFITIVKPSLKGVQLIISHELREDVCRQETHLFKFLKKNVDWVKKGISFAPRTNRWDIGLISPFYNLAQVECCGRDYLAILSWQDLYAIARQAEVEIADLTNYKIKCNGIKWELTGCPLRPGVALIADIRKRIAAYCSGGSAKLPPTLYAAIDVERGGRVWLGGERYLDLKLKSEVAAGSLAAVTFLDRQKVVVVVHKRAISGRDVSKPVEYYLESGTPVDEQPAIKTLNTQQISKLIQSWAFKGAPLENSERIVTGRKVLVGRGGKVVQLTSKDGLPFFLKGIPLEAGEMVTLKLGEEEIAGKNCKTVRVFLRGEEDFPEKCLALYLILPSNNNGVRVDLPKN